MKEFKIQCAQCKETFIVRQYEYDKLISYGKSLPKYCKYCHKDYIMKQHKEKERLENRRWNKKKAEEKIVFEERLKDRKVIDKDSILNHTDHVLYIIGNGFDLLHGVKSSYYDFQKTLGKRSELRFYLENYLNVDDLWADFEEALGHLDVELMANDVTIDTYLDMFEAYEDDASAASFFAAAESAANPAQIISVDLKKRFRTWIESLNVETHNRPLNKLIANNKVLCFNYTEFIESLYHVDHTNICYIHGNRKDFPKNELILGHMPGASDSEYEFITEHKNKKHRYLIETARDITLRNISYYDETLTKHCDKIINDHRDFFQDLKNITDIIVIGHSLSAVDYDYFKEIILNNNNPNNLNWYFSCYGLRDLHNIDEFIASMSIHNNRVKLFRTDGISVTVTKHEELSHQDMKWKHLCTSIDHVWSINEHDGKIIIYDHIKKTIVFSLVFSTHINQAYFIVDNQYVLLISKGIDQGVFLLHYQGETWDYIAEIEPILNQGVINKRLQHLFYTDDQLIFVYNNRVRKYRLLDGKLILNRQVRNAPLYTYPGKEIKII